MKKGDFLKITDDAKYPGQYMEWTETLTSREILPTETILYHFSEDKITEFRAKETCFSTDDRTFGHTYIARLTKPIQVSRYDSSEVRFNISSDNCTIQYIGKTYTKYTGILKVNKYGVLTRNRIIDNRLKVTN